MDNDLEKKAAQAHEIWAHWMRYFLKKFIASVRSEAVFVVPKEDYHRWLHQVETKYENLTEEEKSSDRRVAEKYLMENE